MRINVLTGALCGIGAALALALSGSFVSGQQPPCDFVTGGGYIIPAVETGQKGTLGAAGGCRNGSAWGHLQYIDHGVGQKVHWNSITGYAHDPSDDTARLICGTASTNTDCGDVNFLVRVKDDGDPGFNDEFDIQLERQSDNTICYSTFPGGPHKLGGGTGRGGGNFHLHKPNIGTFGSCSLGGEQFTLTVIIQSDPAGTGTVVSFPIGIDCPGDCSESFGAGTTVTLTADGNGSNADFTDADCDAETVFQPRECTVTMNADRTVRVDFIAQM